MTSTSKSVTTPLKISLAGTPREIGTLHGSLLAAPIRAQIRLYRRVFRHTSRLGWAAVRAIAEGYAATIERLVPELWEEMGGIADGVNGGSRGEDEKGDDGTEDEEEELDILDIVALNCRSEIALGMWSDGCTALGWRIGAVKDERGVADADADGGKEDEGGDRQEGGGSEVFLAQNWDWMARVKENCVLMSIEQVGKPKIWMVTEAGIIGKIGFNSASVGTCLNAIRARPTDAEKLPIHLALRLCLESSTAASAIERLEDLGGVATSCHILIADPNGARGLELSPGGNVYLQPDDRGIVCHTNHFVQNKFVDEPMWLSGSPIRLERIERLVRGLDESGREITTRTLREEIFSDTFNAPQAICCEEDPARPEETRSSTLFNIVMRFGEKTLPSAEVVWGRPGTGEEGPVLHMPW